VQKSANEEQDAIGSAASAQALEIDGAAEAAVSAATTELQSVNREAKGVQGAIEGLNNQIASTQAELDSTFFLNFGKKGELKDAIKELKKGAAAKQKELGKLLEKADKATAAVDKAQGVAAKEKEKAAKIVADAQAAADKVAAAANKKSDGLLAAAQKKADSIVKASEKSAKAAQAAAKRG